MSGGGADGASLTLVSYPRSTTSDQEREISLGGKDLVAVGAL
jgi:hypothetical protein